MKAGILGCGNISGIYMERLRIFPIIEVVGCADKVFERAVSAGEKFGIPACQVDDLFDNPEIDIIVNLTTPDAHASLAIRALESGKSVYNEKPLAINLEDGDRMLRIAKERGLRVGCAPDTFLGAGLQTCRNVLDSGIIGFPVAATAFMLCHGHESWHPSPEFYYQAGGGPMFDMGPYYLTALVHLLGPVRRVNGMNRITFPERIITSPQKMGQKITVDVATHVVGTLEFLNGAIGTIVTSFDVWQHSLPKIEVYGSLGSLRVPDPNGFGGPVDVWISSSKSWESYNLTHNYDSNTRGIGVADMAHAILSGRRHRASGELATHVLEIMHAIHVSSEAGNTITLKTTVDRPAPLPLDLNPGVLDN
jgi:predicted dehydrogenase